MKSCLIASVVAIRLLFLPSLAAAQDSAAPKGIQSEQALPSRYEYVVQDILRLCQPKKGFWVDLGAGSGPVAMQLVEATGNAVVMLDPNREALTEGLPLAREKKIEDRLAAVVGSAESLPFPDNTVDLVVSRGSIFFWDDPVKGLQEVQRVLRPGGKAYIGGGAGSGYPKAAVDKLIQERKEKLQGEEAEKWKRFVELRRPEQMKTWAQAAGLPEFEVLGRGAISADDEKVGQGVWLLFEKKSPAATKPPAIDPPRGGREQTMHPTENRLRSSDRWSDQERQTDQPCCRPSTTSLVWLASEFISGGRDCLPHKPRR